MTQQSLYEPRPKLPPHEPPPPASPPPPSPPPCPAARTLAFPLLCTGAFGFEPHLAVGAMLRAAARFLAAHAEAKLRLLLVSGEAELLAVVEQKRDSAGVARDDARFATLHGSLATLRTVSGHGARFVANDANHRFSPRGSGGTRLLHSTARRVAAARGRDGACPPRLRQAGRRPQRATLCGKQPPARPTSARFVAGHGAGREEEVGAAPRPRVLRL